jgi:general secretion pathway protein D
LEKSVSASGYPPTLQVTEGMILRDTTEKMILKPIGGDPTPAIPPPLPDLVPKPAPVPPPQAPQTQ